MKKIIFRIPFAFTLVYYVLFCVSFLFIFNKNQSNLTFVVGGKGWILERICKEIKACFRGNSLLHYSTRSIPKSNTYFFSLYREYLTAAVRNPYIFLGNIYVFYTHYTPGPFSKRDLARVLNLVKKIFVVNSKDRDFLIEIGVNPKKIKVVFLGVNEKLFLPSKNIESAQKTIGFCLRYENWGDYTYRKNHGKIIDLVKALDSYQVILLGYRWENYERFSEIKSLKHFKYIETDYSNYQDYYKQMDVFVSVSRVEGAPMPLLEAMFCNVFPVVSDTGFARDLIKPGKNGLIFETEASVQEILKLIQQATAVQEKVNVRSTVEHLTWKHFGEKIISFMENS